MPLGQRVAHMRPEGRLRIRDLRGELLVGARDGLPRGESGEDPRPSDRLRTYDGWWRGETADCATSQPSSLPQL